MILIKVFVGILWRILLSLTGMTYGQIAHTHVDNDLDELFSIGGGVVGTLLRPYQHHKVVYILQCCVFSLYGVST